MLKPEMPALAQAGTRLVFVDAMRLRIGELAAVLLLMGGCGGSFGDLGGGADAGTDRADATVRDVADAAVNVTDDDEDGIPDSSDNCPNLANTAQADRDGDDYGDACDCEPDDNTVAATMIAEDSLATATTLLTPAVGFPANSWLYENDGYAQDRLEDESADATFFGGKPLTDVRVRVTAASTEVDSFDGDDLRQLFIVARATSNAAAYSALACGIEIVEALNDSRKTSIIALGGTPAIPTTSALARNDREQLDTDEEFEVVLELRGGAMTCIVTIDGTTTTATTADAPVSAGAVGFYTRETKSLFKNVQLCSYRTTAAPD